MAGGGWRRVAVKRGQSGTRQPFQAGGSLQARDAPEAVARLRAGAHRSARTLAAELLAAQGSRGPL